MTTSDDTLGKFPPGHGHAWRGDWKNRLADLIARRGAASATAFADAHPTATLDDLAQLLGPGDVAAVQVQWALLAEASALGNAALERYARSTLARELRGLSPAGWDNGDDFKGGTFGAWSAALPNGYEAIALATWDAIVASRPPSGWLPSGPDDPILVAAFAGHWRPPEPRA